MKDRTILYTMPSAVALLGLSKGHVSTAAKGVILSCPRGLEGSYVYQGVRANAICPGLAITERVILMFADPHKTPSLPLRPLLEKSLFSMA